MAFYVVGAEDGQYPFPALLDPEHSLARAVEARVTPSVAVLTPAGELLYRGRIDDRVVTFGQVRARARREDLWLVLERVTAGKRVRFAETPALGCDIPWPRGEARTEVTFSREVPPILYQHCAGCHRPGEVGPFPLPTGSSFASTPSICPTGRTSAIRTRRSPRPRSGGFKEREAVAFSRCRRSTCFSSYSGVVSQAEQSAAGKRGLAS